MRKSTVFTKSFGLYIINPCQTRQNGFMKTTLFLELHFLAFTKTTETIDKKKRCHLTLGGLSSISAKLQPVSSKNNEIIEINVLQKFTPHGLYTAGCLQAVI